MLFWTRLFAYSILPLLLATGHMLLDKKSRTPARRIELFFIYIFALSVGAAGIGGFFGHLFLSDLVAESIGWPTGSGFQLEMGFANLALGVLGLIAIGRRDGFRLATIIATTVIGVGATYVHLQDIVLHGNLAPGNTIQNFANLLDPMLLILLLWLSGRVSDPDAESPAFLRWQLRQQPIAGWSAAGAGMGFGLGFATGALFPVTLLGALVGVGVGLLFARYVVRDHPEQTRAGNEI